MITKGSEVKMMSNLDMAFQNAYLWSNAPQVVCLEDIVAVSLRDTIVTGDLIESVGLHTDHRREEVT